MSLLILLSNVYFSIAKKIISHLQKIINEASWIAILIACCSEIYTLPFFSFLQCSRYFLKIKEPFEVVFIEDEYTVHLRYSHLHEKVFTYHWPLLKAKTFPRFNPVMETSVHLLVVKRAASSLSKCWALKGYPEPSSLRLSHTSLAGRKRANDKSLPHLDLKAETPFLSNLEVWSFLCSRREFD